MTLPEADILAARILIVDDQAANVRLLERLLGEAGYTNVSSTMDPHAVCGLHRRMDYDLILLDLQLPGMDGFAVMAALQAGVTASYLPVIVLTAQPAHKLRALQVGAKDFISKPFDLLEVKTRIHNMLEVRLLYRRLEENNRRLEQVVAERTAELRESEARFRSLTELSTDWYWEQDESGSFTKVCGPVMDMLGLRVSALDGSTDDDRDDGWDEAERAALRACIEARRPFLDFVIHRVHPDGTSRRYRVSGEPMLSQACSFIGYRGVGVEILDRAPYPLARPANSAAA
jgi:PAS domain S-box-containing protein